MNLATYQLDLNQPQNTDILHSIVEENQKIIYVYMMCVNNLFTGVIEIYYGMDDISYLHDQVVRQSKYVDPSSHRVYSQYMPCSDKTFSDMIEYNTQC